MTPRKCVPKCMYKYHFSILYLYNFNFLIIINTHPYLFFFFTFCFTKLLYIGLLCDDIHRQSVYEILFVHGPTQKHCQYETRTSFDGFNCFHVIYRTKVLLELIVQHFNSRFLTVQILGPMKTSDLCLCQSLKSILKGKCFSNRG